MLRVKLSADVGPSDLLALHAARSVADVPDPFGNLIRRAGIVHLRPVYELSPAEIASDDYGFAREFALTVKAGTDTKVVVAALVASDLIAEARPVYLRQSS